MLFCTTFEAIDRRDMELKVWRGPNVEAIGVADAQFIITSKGFHHLKVEGLIYEDGDDNSEKLKWQN